jgi:cellulose synthase/poly-beta-1,6-N-acetylglucosamine synthase-like glycosyltransferase
VSKLERVHAALYAALICVFVASGALFGSQFLTSTIFWERFTLAYLGVLVLYTWYVFTLLLVHDVRPRRYPAYGGEKIAVLIPCYNEDPELVEDSIRMVLAAYGNKQVIVIDDGSTNGIQKRLRELEQELPIRVHEFPTNLGKREALHYATTQMLDDDVAFVVTIDSDTLLETQALVRVVEPLLSPNIGASTGNVLLLNERQNLLTRMIGTYYWVGLNIY